MIVKLLDSLYFGGWKWYRKLRGGTWRYVGPKYTHYACWINTEPFDWEHIWKVEYYGNN